MMRKLAQFVMQSPFVAAGLYRAVQPLVAAVKQKDGHPFTEGVVAFFEKCPYGIVSHHIKSLDLNLHCLHCLQSLLV